MEDMEQKDDFTFPRNMQRNEFCINVYQAR